MKKFPGQPSGASEQSVCQWVKALLDIYLRDVLARGD